MLHARGLRPGIAVFAAAMLAVSGLSACSGSGDPSPPSRHELVVALDRHAAAVRDHDRSAFLAGVDDEPAAAAFRASQRGEFDNLAHLPVRRWRYTLAAPVHAPGAQALARSRFGPSARIVKVTLHAALAGVDPVPAEHDLWWTVARVGGHVVICADDALDRLGGVSWRGPWDFGPLSVVRGAHSLVLGPPGAQDGLRRVASAVDRAVPAVTAVWGTDWTRDVEVVVPSSSAELAAALGTDAAGAPAVSRSGAGETADVAALAVSDGLDPVTGRAVGQRVVVVQQAFDRLTPLGRRIVVTHEVTHIASAAATGGASPRWLVEGLAEYVGNLHTGQPLRSAASELVSRVRRDGVPRALPGDAAFDTASTAAAAYEQAWLACRLIASKVGNAGLVRLYTRVGASGMSTRTAVSGALRTVLHETVAQFTGQWRAYLSDLLS